VNKITIEFEKAMTYDQLQTLSNEYTRSVEQLINYAVERLITDVEFVRNLREESN
jgi:hypothetical protein